MKTEKWYIIAKSLFRAFIERNKFLSSQNLSKIESRVYCLVLILLAEK